MLALSSTNVLADLFHPVSGRSDPFLPCNMSWGLKYQNYYMKTMCCSIGGFMWEQHLSIYKHPTTVRHQGGGSATSTDNQGGCQQGIGNLSWGCGGVKGCSLYYVDSVLLSCLLLEAGMLCCKKGSHFSRITLQPCGLFKYCFRKEGHCFSLTRVQEAAVGECPFLFHRGTTQGWAYFMFHLALKYKPQIQEKPWTSCSARK